MPSPSRIAGSRLISLLVAASCLMPVPASSQGRGAAAERFFKVDWHVERRDGRDVAVVGQVRNDYLYTLRRVELQLQVLDAAGQVIAEVFGRIDRDIPPSASATFRLPLSETGSRYAVLVHSFDFGARESP